MKTGLLVGVLVSKRVSFGPVCAVHTIPADDTALALAHEAGRSWVTQLFDWSEIEPLPGEYFWEYPDAVARAYEYHRLNLAVRLDHPPSWALSLTGDGLLIDEDAYARSCRPRG